MSCDTSHGSGALQAAAMKGSMPCDPSSPTRMPIPPSTTSSGSRQRGNGYNGGQGAPLGSSPRQAMYGSGLVSGCGGCPNLCGQDLRYQAGSLAQSQMQCQNVPQMPFQNMMQQNFQPGIQNSSENMLFGAGFSPSVSVPVGPCLGGMTPQASRMHRMFEMSKGLSASQLMTVVQGLQEQLKSQGRETPDVFGQRPLEGSGGKGSGGVPQLNFGLDAGAEMKHVDVFSKSEKWLGSPPVPSVASWTSRDAEVIGWSTYVSSLSTWAAQASMDFSIEIQQASRWPSSISWETLQPQKQARALRLHAILKAAFNEHPRTNDLISAFGEGVKLIDNDGSGLNTCCSTVDTFNTMMLYTSWLIPETLQRLLQKRQPWLTGLQLPPSGPVACTTLGQAMSRSIWFLFEHTRTLD